MKNIFHENLVELVFFYNKKQYLRENLSSFKMYRITNVDY